MTLVSLWLTHEIREQDHDRFETLVNASLEDLNSSSEHYGEMLARVTEHLEACADPFDPFEWDETLERLDPANHFPALAELALVRNPNTVPVASLLNTLSQTTLDAPSPTPTPPPNTTPVIASSWYSDEIDPTGPVALHDWLNTPQAQNALSQIHSGHMAPTGRRYLPEENGTYSCPAVSLVKSLMPLDFNQLRGALLLQPHYRAKGIPNAVLHTLRQQCSQGAIIASIDWDLFLESHFVHHFPGLLVSATILRPDSPGTETSTSQSLDSATLIVPTESRYTELHTTRPWLFHGQDWLLDFYPTPAFFEQSPKYLEMFIWIGGCTLAIISGIIFALQTLSLQRERRLSNELDVTVHQLDASIAEQRRLSHDLHDEVIQELYSLQLTAKHAEKQIEHLAPQLQPSLANISQQLRLTSEKLRRYIQKENPAHRESTDFNTILQTIVAQVQQGHSIPIRTHLDPTATALLNNKQCIQLATLAREALSNAVRHAQAKTITLQLQTNPTAVTLEISDDGTGFDPQHISKPGIGLRSMETRALDTGGHFEILPRPTGGTIVRVTIPRSKT
jgi:signal transduction histidine kinase